MVRMSYEDKSMSKHTPEPKQKYCKDCKWCSGPYGPLRRFLDDICLPGPTKDPYRHSMCIHPDLQRRGDDSEILLSGFKEPDSPYFCATNRISRCGPEGKHWEAKQL